MNKEKLMGYWEKVKSALGKVSKKIWILIAAVLVVCVVGVVVFLNTRPYAPLIDGATNDDLATVLNWLDAQEVKNYRVDTASGAVLVPEAQAPTLKAKLLQEQYSSSNASFSGYFERVSALSTVKDRDNAWLVTLIEVMNDTIRQFDGVMSASVTIQPGEDNGYILDTNNVVNASASVFITMQSGKELTMEQANAIRNYVSHSVPNLDVENVTITDSKGTDYENFDIVGTSASDQTALKLQTEKYIASQIKKQLASILEATYGKDHVSVSVNATVELGSKTINDYLVTLPEFAQDGSTNGAGILGNQYYAYRIVNGDETTAGGVVGTATNSEISDYVESGEPQGQLQEILEGEGSKEYDNSKTQTYMEINCATLTDVYVGVSIDSSVTGPLDTELIRNFVAATAGIVPNIDMTELTTEQYQLQKTEYLSQKVGILIGPWYHEPETPAPPTFMETLQNMGIAPWVFFAAIGGLVLFIIVLVLIIVLVRRSKKKKQEAEQKAVEELLAVTMAQQPGQDVPLGPDGEPVPIPVDENGDPIAGANVMDLHTERSMELRQEIRDFVDENMEVAALLIKSWLKEDGDHG